MSVGTQTEDFIESISLQTSEAMAVENLKKVISFGTQTEDLIFPKVEIVSKRKFKFSIANQLAKVRKNRLKNVARHPRSTIKRSTNKRFQEMNHEKENVIQPLNVTKKGKNFYTDRDTTNFMQHFPKQRNLDAEYGENIL